MQNLSGLRDALGLAMECRRTPWGICSKKSDSRGMVEAGHALPFALAAGPFGYRRQKVGRDANVHKTLVHRRRDSGGVEHKAATLAAHAELFRNGTHGNVVLQKPHPQARLP